MAATLHCGGGPHDHAQAPALWRGGGRIPSPQGDGPVTPSRAIGAAVANARRRLRWSQERLAEEAGLSLRSVKRLESGATMRLSTLEDVLEAIDVELVVDVRPWQ